MSYGVFKTEALRLAATSDMWTFSNPVLENGAIGAELDTGKFKIGNGSSTWTALSYMSTSGAGSITAATTSALGGVIVGTGLTVNGSGLLSANVTSVAGRQGAIVLTVADVTGAAPLASPTFTGTVTVPTATAGDNSTKAASTAFVANAVSAYSVPHAGIETYGTVQQVGTPTVDTWTDATAQGDFQALINALVSAGILVND
jgi:hypothetical protein